MKDTFVDVPNMTAAGEPRFVHILCPDLNGILRGKWVTGDKLQSVMADGVRMPRSFTVLDIWGRDCAASGLVFETGDLDGVSRMIEGTLAPVPFANEPSVQILHSMTEMDGSPYFADPRTILARAVARLKALGLAPMVAVELEFYLVNRDEHGRPLPARGPRSGRSVRSAGTYSLNLLDDFAPVFEAITEGARLQGIPVNTAIKEAGAGQMEMNLHHQADACVAADHAILFRRLAKGVASAHGMDATFMAKPFGDQPGNGMHVHVSLLDSTGTNVFMAGGDKNPKLLNAVAGLQQTLPQSMLMLAPHMNSYRRLRPGWHAPVTASWGVDNRTCAIRVADPGAKAARIEHRLAGADANPYLAVAAILMGIAHGLEQELSPTAPVTGSSYDLEGEPRLPITWERAIEAFAGGDVVKDHLGADFARVYLATKEQEYDSFLGRISDAEYEAYLTEL